jgi:hypothetical protein
MYRFTVELASFTPPKPEQEVLFRALAGRQKEIDRFLGVLACAISPMECFSPRNLRRLIGLRGFLTIAREKMRRPSAADTTDGATEDTAALSAC